MRLPNPAAGESGDDLVALIVAPFDIIVDTTVATVPLDADRLPEDAGQRYDAGPAHPQVMRFLMWHRPTEDLARLVPEPQRRRASGRPVGRPE